MQITSPKIEFALPTVTQRVGWAVLAVLAAWLCVPEIAALWPSWRGDAALSHGPIVPLITAGLLWMGRDDLRQWRSASVGGLAALILSVVIYVGAVWADIDFLKPLALIGAMIAAVWFLGEAKTLRAAAPALGLLVFIIPWPTTLVDRLAFPLQLTSSSYAALFAGMLGVPIHREGVQMFVMPNPDAKPIYSIVVAQQCSGLTSLMVLLLLGYLTAYFTPVKAYWRIAMVAAVVPLALFANAVRLTIILFAGAHGSPALAQWIHDHEGPVLIFFCSMGLMGLRHLLLTSQRPDSDDEENQHDPLPPIDPERPLIISGDR